MYGHISNIVFGNEYDVEEGIERALAHMPNERCLYCHDDLLAKPDSEAGLRASPAGARGLSLGVFAAATHAPAGNRFLGTGIARV